MEQLFWRSNENREKARFLRRWEIFSRPKTSASEGRRIKLPCGSDKILLGSQFRRPRFLAKISNASQKWSLFLGVSEGLFLAKNSNALYTKSLRVSEKTVPSFLAKISNASQKSSSFLVWKEDLAFARTPGVGATIPGRVRGRTRLPYRVLGVVPDPEERGSGRPKSPLRDSQGLQMNLYIRVLLQMQMFLIARLKPCLQIPFERRDKNKIICKEDIENE